MCVWLVIVVAAAGAAVDVARSVLRFEFVVVVMLFGIMDILHTYESYKAQATQESEAVVMSPSRKVY